MQIVPPRFCHIGIKNERSVVFKIRQNPFPVRPLPRTPLGSSWRSPRPPSRLRSDTPPHIPLHSAPTNLRRSPCVPRIPARSTPMTLPIHSPASCVSLFEKVNADELITTPLDVRNYKVFNVASSRVMSRRQQKMTYVAELPMWRCTADAPVEPPPLSLSLNMQSYHATCKFTERQTAVEQYGM